MSCIAKILVVDDNPKFLSDILPQYGYEVVVATDGLQALQILTKKKVTVDLVLLDIMMPNMDGWDTLKAIKSKKDFKLLPIIMLTALNSEQKEISGLRFGADDYITKPFSIPNLLARIEAVLRRSNLEAETSALSSITMNLPFVSDEPIEPLTAKEKEVLMLVAKGNSNGKIADKLCVKEITVKTHMNRIFKKLNVTSRTQAVLLAMQMNIIK